MWITIKTAISNQGGSWYKLMNIIMMNSDPVKPIELKWVYKRKKELKCAACKSIAL